MYPGKFAPTQSHFFVRLLQEKGGKVDTCLDGGRRKPRDITLGVLAGLLLRHYTQNIDTLEREAGLREDKLVEAHGAFTK